MGDHDTIRPRYCPVCGTPEIGIHYGYDYFAVICPVCDIISIIELR